MKILIIILVLLATLMRCGGKYVSKDIENEFGDSIATLDSATYYWKQLATDSARISVVKDNKESRNVL